MGVNRPFQILNSNEVIGHHVTFLLCSSFWLIPFASEPVFSLTVERPPFSVPQLKESRFLKKMHFPKDSRAIRVILGGLSFIYSQPRYFPSVILSGAHN